MQESDSAATRKRTHSCPTRNSRLNRIVGGKIVEEWSEGTYAYELAQQRLNHELRERERVEQELLVARRIQQASLPREVPTLEGWQINPYCQPAREVGGDFYDFPPPL